MGNDQAFEAKHYLMRKSKDGVVISFVVHPDDVTPELQCLPIGARVMVGWKEIGDDEKPKDTKVPVLNHGPEGPRPKRKFAEMSLPEQCGVRCADGRFQRFLSQEYTSDGSEVGGERAATVVREILQVSSRSDLSSNHDAANRWRSLETHFQQWLTDETYKDQAR